MHDKPDTIEITAAAETEVVATCADVDLEVEGSSIFTGDEAFKKARELRELFDLLIAAGLEPDQLTIRGIRLSSEGLLGWKSSSCHYSVRIRRIKSELLPQALGSIAAKKGVTMSSLSWRFGNLEAELAALRQRAMTDLMTKARLSADLLGVELLGIHSFRESIASPEAEPRVAVKHGSWDSAAVMRKHAVQNLGVAISSRGLAGVTVSAEFRVSAFRTGT